MAWFEEAIFYHIYPLGLTGAPKKNQYGEPENRIRNLYTWVDHIHDMGFNALYIGPLFESVGHGYETTDYYKVDSRLGTNDDLTFFVQYCHEQGIRVVLDGVFNHVGRDFFAFRDLKENRERSRYLYWFCNVDFWGDNSCHDGFRYDNWGGYDLLVKLNQQNPEVQQYICDVIRFWVNSFDIDGIRLDAADVLDFGFMQCMRQTAEEVKQDFWLMGEVIHGDYSRWVNDRTLHSVTNYRLHKALYSGHNDQNYFEIAHTVREVRNGNQLYSFVDNHDVERIYSKLRNKANFMPVHVLLFTLPGIPSVYYGSEFAVDGKKNRWSDDSLRPALDLADYRNSVYSDLIKALCTIRRRVPALIYGGYHEQYLTTGQFVFSRVLDDQFVLIAVNNSPEKAYVELHNISDGAYRGVLSGKNIRAEWGSIQLELPGNSGEIWIPENISAADYKPVQVIPRRKSPQKKSMPAESPVQEISVNAQKPYDEMSIEELQNAILAKLSSNGPLTERMRREVAENVYRNSLLNWVRSFR